MNSKSIHIDHNAESTFDSIALQPASIFGRIYKGLRSLLVRGELEKAQAGYRAKQQRQGSQQDVLRDFSIEDKLRYGMHRWMD